MSWKALLIVALAALPSPAAAADPPKPSADAAALSARIDAILEAAWKANRIVPAADATDGEFLRRVYLDLAGRIPTVAEARAFLADKGSDKRRRLVAELLHRPTYARHMTEIWRHLLIPEADTNLQLSFFATQFESWLRDQFAKDAGYDKMVSELLTAPIDQPQGRPVRSEIAQKLTPITYYYMKEGKAENLAASSARVFLGLRLECAQCHDHPFATWTREQFWGLAAFFGGIKAQDNGNGFAFPTSEALDRRELEIPGTKRIVQAAFPDGAEPQWKLKAGPRQTLANWVTAKNNPYFARATANRVWSLMFGTGLVEPVDEMVGGQDTKILDADLLNELATGFVAHQCNLKFLFEAIAGSKAYQLCSKGTGPAPLFSRQVLRGLSGEQLYDSLAVATWQPNATGDDPYGRFRGGNQVRGEFLAKFGQQNGKATEKETSIVQALTLMNGVFVSAATHPARSELLGAVLEAPFLNEKSRIETIYLATMSRFPGELEMQKVNSFIGRRDVTGDPKKGRDEAVTDVFWALLNSAEFVFNH